MLEAAVEAIRTAVNRLGHTIVAILGLEEVAEAATLEAAHRPS